MIIECDELAARERLLQVLYDVFDMARSCFE